MFSTPRATKALGDYLAKDVLDRYARKGHGIRLDASTKLLFGQMMLRTLMQRINTTAKRMKAKGLNKGKLVKAHPMYPNIR